MYSSTHNAGCSVMIFYIVIITAASYVGNLLLGYNLESWLGYEHWTDVNIIIRLILGFISFTVALPLAIIAFLLVLVFGTPLLV